MNWQFAPLAHRIWRTQPRRRTSRFKASWSTTLDDLARETAYLGVTGQVIIAVATRPEDIGSTGRQLLRGPREPQVAVSFTGRHGTLTYPCNTYDWWEVNVRAIALTLRALRSIDRYGVAPNGEQYAGFRALEAPSVSFASADDAVAWLARFTGDEPALGWQALLRRATFRAHPDRGGDPLDWARVDAARQLLRDAN